MFFFTRSSFKAFDDPNSHSHSAESFRGFFIPKHRQDNKRKNNKKNHHHQIIMQGARQSDVFFGERESGQDVRQSNVTAVQAVANIVKSSLGPVGLDKVSYCFRGKKSTLASDRFFLSAARFVTRRLARFILLQNAEEY